MAKKNLTYWYLGGAAALAAVGYILYVRKVVALEPGVPDSTRSGGSAAPPPSGSTEKASISKGKDYIVVVGFSDPSVMSDVQTDLSSWGSNITAVGSSHDINGKVIGHTLQVTGTRGVYVVYPKRVNTPSGKYYDLLAIRKAGTA